MKDDFGIVKGNQALSSGQESDVGKEAASIKPEQARGKKIKVQQEMWKKEGERTRTKSHG